MHHSLCQRMLLLGCLATAAALPGCGPAGKPAGKVEGRITYKGEPISAGQVNFHSRTTGVGAGAKLDGGKFALAQPLEVGEYVVYVTPPKPEPTDPRKGPAPVIRSDIPMKARDMTTSGLTATIRPGDNKVEIDIKD